MLSYAFLKFESLRSQIRKTESLLGLDETREGGGNICEVRDAWQMNQPDPGTTRGQANVRKLNHLLSGYLK